jgi:hypothetical protein
MYFVWKSSFVLEVELLEFDKGEKETRSREVQDHRLSRKMVTSRDPTKTLPLDASLFTFPRITSER